MFSMRSINKKHFIFMLMLMFLVFFAFYVKDTTKNEDHWSFSTEKPLLDENATAQLKIESVKKNLDFVAASNAANVPLDNSASRVREVETLAGTPSEAEIVRKWDESRGRFNEESLKDYAGYDMDTLKSLVDGGDLKAMIALSKLYISEKYAGEYGLEYSMPLLKKAAAYGSSYALELYATGYDASHYVDGTYTHDVLLEVLAWNNTAAIRGDMYPNNSARVELKMKKVQLNDVDVQKIRARSEEIYNEILAERKALGLGDFDNNVPPEVKKFFSYFENYMDAYK